MVYRPRGAIGVEVEVEVVDTEVEDFDLSLNLSAALVWHCPLPPPIPHPGPPPVPSGLRRPGGPGGGALAAPHHRAVAAVAPPPPRRAARRGRRPRYLTRAPAAGDSTPALQDTFLDWPQLRFFLVHTKNEMPVWSISLWGPLALFIINEANEASGLLPRGFRQRVFVN